MKSKYWALTMGIGAVLYIAAWVATWLWLSLSVVSPWLTSLGLVAWASAVISLVFLGIACFWVGMFLFMILVAILGWFADEA